MAINISIVILVKNSSQYIGQCLNVLTDFDDIVVYDNGSTDGSQDICTSYENVHLVEGTFTGFGSTKNRAASFAKYDWIFSLDSDEILSERLIKTLKDLNPVDDHVYRLQRRNFYKDREIKYCWKNDTVMRIYHKKNTKFNDNLVHESVIAKNMEIQVLDGYIKHYSYHSISDFILKTDKYSTLFAEQNSGKQKSTPVKAVLHAFFAFFKTYIMKRGFMDGYIGLVISYSQASEKFYKYMKLYEKNKDL